MGTGNIVNTITARHMMPFRRTETIPKDVAIYSRLANERHRTANHVKFCSSFIPEFIVFSRHYFYRSGYGRQRLIATNTNDVRWSAVMDESSD